MPVGVAEKKKACIELSGNSVVCPLVVGCNAPFLNVSTVPTATLTLVSCPSLLRTVRYSFCAKSGAVASNNIRLSKANFIVLCVGDKC